MARPRGEIREILSQALQERSSAGATVRQLAEFTQVGYDAAKMTVENMVRAREVASIGRDKPAGSAHWERIYALVQIEEAPQPWGGIEALTAVMREVVVSSSS